MIPSGDVLPRSLSSECGGEMETRMLSTIAVNVLKRVICKKDAYSDECAAFSRASKRLESDRQPPCPNGDMQCSRKGSDKFCVAISCKNDVKNLPQKDKLDCE